MSNPVGPAPTFWNGATPGVQVVPVQEEVKEKGITGQHIAIVQESAAHL